ncbi:lantibiotic dehydratase [Kitasatospora sp. NPDC058965]|uniref:lantibiotic dehydratase n=1 Tax=Kitasatospora sp. NPDC058965 TaxID=3346682 RepID=UPI0036B51713
MSDGRSDGYSVSSARYALVRATVLRHPAERPGAAAFRTELARLTALTTELAESSPQLGDALYASRSGHSQDFHREVVLPLRRSLHHGRPPRPALLDRLADLPERVPELAGWLTLRRRHAEVLAAAEQAAPTALAADREALSALCREPALARAIALTSTDLLRAVQRAGTGATDRRARKEEPGVLRYALRASTKTSPFSWFTAVGWGPLVPGPGAGRPAVDLAAQTPASVVEANRTLVAALIQALLASPRRRAAVPHRMASSARIADGRAGYARTRPVFAGGRYLTTSEEEVALAAGGPLAFVTEQCRLPSSLDELTRRLGSALGHGEAGAAAAAAFLARLAEADLLVPCEPLDPQGEAPLEQLAQWLRAWPEDAPLVEQISELAVRTGTFADSPAARRPAVLADLTTRWAELLAGAGRPVPEQGAPLTVLAEDVVLPAPIPPDALLSPADTEALRELTPLAELFDLGQVVRRLVRDRFVARYGPGGSCPHIWEFGPEVAHAWEQAWQMANLAPGPALPSGLAELAELRAAVRAQVRAANGPEAGDVVLPTAPVRDLGPRLPAWVLERPLSYAYFVQRDADEGLLCVNHVYGGWGRFTSRFLGSLDPAATVEVARQVRRGLGRSARAAQVRPVGGFNANVHPLLVPDEIGPDRRWASIGESELDLVHDRAGDQVRFRLRATGELLDVLYLGFLSPVMLPRRLTALLSDHPHGVVDLRPLLPHRTLPAPGGQVARTPRLTYRHLVLERRRWQLPAEVAGALRAELAADHEVPAATVARWRSLLGLPEQLFLRPAPVAAQRWTADQLVAQLQQPKPQFLDLGSALHLRCLSRWLARHPAGVVLEEALPAPGGRPEESGAVELVAEVFRAGRSREAERSGPDAPDGPTA